MTASGYRRRQRRKGYPAQAAPILRWQLDAMSARGVQVGRMGRVLLPEHLAPDAFRSLSWRGRAG
jgi:hypothetical protein